MDTLFISLEKRKSFYSHRLAPELSHKIHLERNDKYVCTVISEYLPHMEKYEKVIS